MTDNTQPNPGSDDTFSDAEAAFFSSGGKVAEGLFEAPKVETPPPAEEKPVANVETKTEDVEPGEVALDDSGRVRDAKTGRYVPLPVLKKEREEHKATRKERDELRDKWSRLEAKWTMQQEILATDDGEPGEGENGKAKAKSDNPWDEADIDPEKDVFGAFQQERRRNAWNRKQAEEVGKKTEATISAERAQRSYEADVRRFSEKQTDYADAYKHLLMARAQQLMLTSKAFRSADGKEPNMDAIRQQLRLDEAAIRDQALTDGESVAERIYGLAKLHGYAPKQQAQTNGSTQTNGTGKTTAQEKVEQIEAGKEGARTLNGAGGGAKPGLTLEEYLAMDENVIVRRMREEPAFKRQVEALHGKR